MARLDNPGEVLTPPILVVIGLFRTMRCTASVCKVTANTTEIGHSGQHGAHLLAAYEAESSKLQAVFG